MCLLRGWGKVLHLLKRILVKLFINFETIALCGVFIFEEINFCRSTFWVFELSFAGKLEVSKENRDYFFTEENF